MCFKKLKKIGGSVALSFLCVLAVPFSSAYASDDGASEQAAASVYVIRANGNVESPKGSNELPENEKSSPMVKTPMGGKDNAVSPMGSGEWDYLGIHYTASGENPSDYVFSGGGSFKYQIYYGPKDGAWYELRERDPDNTDDIIYGNGYRYFWLYPGDVLVYSGLNFAVDGDNNKAEFYVKEGFTGAAQVKYWD